MTDTPSHAPSRIKEIEANVYEAALERFRSLFERFDTVVVSFSGGKDSTIVLNLALQVADEMGKGPVDVLFVDEEVNTPETLDYMERVRQRPNVRLKWCCLPILHRNACSREETWWTCWDPSVQDRWVRQMPDIPELVTVKDVPRFKTGMKLPDVGNTIYGPEYGTVADCAGIRAQESLRRMKAILGKTQDNYIADPLHGYYYYCKPIYDWKTEDVWTAIGEFKWDYNRTYDILRMMGTSPSSQRVCPPWGEEPLAGLWEYAEGWPELWDAMTERVKGCSTAGKYARTDLYGWMPKEPPTGMTWQQWAMSLLELYPAKERKEISHSMANCIKLHRKKTKRPIPDATADIYTGVSWRAICRMCLRGDLKGRVVSSLPMRAVAERQKLGISMEDALEADKQDTIVI